MILTRRDCFTSLPLLVQPLIAQSERNARPLGISLYGMKSLDIPTALKVCRQIGYAGVEFALLPGHPTDPDRVTDKQRKELRQKLADSGLQVHGWMENLPALGTAETHKKNLERLKAAAEFAHAIAPEATAPLETVLGSRPGDWQKVRELLTERVGEWAEVGQRHQMVIAIKPHVAQVLRTLEAAVGLMKAINSPWLRLAFDYSHFELQGVKLAEALSKLLPFTVFIHVKDTQGTADKFEFLLPGQGRTDYAAYAQLLSEGNYPGAVVVEVSSQIFSRPGYDPVEAAKGSYSALAKYFMSHRK